MSEQARAAEAIFIAALDMATLQERAAYVESACAGQVELLQRVQELLAAHAQSHGPLDAPPAYEGATVDQPLIAERPGAHIGPYKLLQQIGVGGMGVVYMAEQQEPVRRKVALKIVKPGMDSGQVIARFEAERQALAMMDHQYIARVLDAGTTQSGRPYFVMELVHGVPITQFCDDHQLSPRQRLELFIPVCQAIQHAHQKGIIHRDVKPSNVLVTLYDDKPVPKVIDFGVAKAVEQRLTDKTLFTQFGALVGTFEYMSPEQAEMNAFGVDTRSDIYSLGVLLYELLTGTTPLEKARVRAAALNEVVRLIKEEEPPRPSARLSSSGTLKIAAARKTEPAQLARLVRGELDWIVMKSLEKDRRRRYDTATGMAQDVERYLSDELVQAGPPSAAYRLRKFVKRNRGPVVVAAVVALTLLAGIVGTSWGWIDAVQARKDEADALALAVKNEKLAEERRGDAEILADSNKLLAEKEGMARLEADRRRAHAETLAMRIEFEHYFSKAGDRPDLALVGMANLLPKAARLKDRSVTDLLRLQVGSWSEHVARLSAMYEHQDEVRAVALSADGKTALTGSLDSTARLWATATGKPIGPPLQHRDQIRAVALSADGKTALTGSADNTARLWETASGKSIGPPLKHHGDKGFVVVALSANGQLALTGSPDKTARLWETATGKPVGAPLQHQAPVWAVALSADGKTAVTGSANTAQLWETATGKPVGPPLQHGPTAHIAVVVLSADGKTALTGSHDKTARLWHAATGKLIGLPLPHQGVVDAVALSADSKTALTGSRDKTARLWEVATGKPIGPPMQHQGAIVAVALSADGKTALTGSDDKTARLWEAATGRPIGPPLQHREWVGAVALSADGKIALTGSRDKTARLWETTVGRRIDRPLQHQGTVIGVALSADGRTALTASGNTAQLWAAGQPIGLPLLHQKLGLVVALSADGKTALTGSWDRTAHLWEATTGKPIGLPLLHQFTVHAVALSADGKIALTGNHDKTARLWDTATGQPLGAPLRHQAEIRAVALSADGRTALTGSHDNTARVWATATSKPIGPPLQHRGIVFAVALSSDGSIALTGSWDNTARLWDTATGTPIGPPLRHQDAVVAVALSVDGKVALTGSHDNTARLWETATSKPIGMALSHQSAVVAVGLSADGKTALTGSYDNTARLWETATGKPIGPPLEHQGAVRVVALSADGKTALTGSYDKTARLWHVPQLVRGDPERIMLWARVITGLEVDELTAVHVMNAATWQQRRRRLEQLGGPP